MITPYLDHSIGESISQKEFSIHGLKSNHLVVIYQAIKLYNHSLQLDTDLLTSKLEELTSTDIEMLFCNIDLERAANDMIRVLGDME